MEARAKPESGLPSLPGRRRGQLRGQRLGGWRRHRVAVACSGSRTPARPNRSTARPRQGEQAGRALSRWRCPSATFSTWAHVTTCRGPTSVPTPAASPRGLKILAMNSSGTGSGITRPLLPPAFAPVVGGLSRGIRTLLGERHGEVHLAPPFAMTAPDSAVSTRPNSMDISSGAVPRSRLTTVPIAGLTSSSARSIDSRARRALPLAEPRHSRGTSPA